ncbi:MAG: cell division protein FtsZ [Tannerella sp.]|jgi:cell division protein FtsZ|nr:cell division protein FtsZ [Tannerella sp.]
MNDIKLHFAVPTDTQKIIKVIGVGGGGGNAVSHMYRAGIHDVSFVLCNTDVQAMNRSEVPVKLCLGPKTTKGLGSGNNPARAREAALESENEIRNMLNDGTEMVFITAGMGGGTGTGAAPVIARIAKDMEILTVGIVTIPFVFEQRPKILQALTGVEEMNRNVDALLVINNERLYDIYKDLTLRNAFAKVDDILTIAAKNIAEIVTITGIINVDLADVRTTMKDSGIALMSEGYGEGEERLDEAIENAFKSPLLNNSNIFNAKKMLFNVSFGKGECENDELSIAEIGTYITSFMDRFSSEIELIWGAVLDESLGKKIKFTLLASGFELADKTFESSMQSGDDKKRTKDEIRHSKEYQEYLIRKYYGNMLNRRPAPAISILTLEEMENEAFVKIIEKYPTYKRNPSLVESIRNKISLENQKRKNEQIHSEDEQPIISDF